MAKSDLLRVHDVRDAYRLIGECRDVGSDPALWHRRMLEGLCRLAGVRAASGGEGRWRRPERAVEAISGFEVGLDSRGRERFQAYMREVTPARDPVYNALQSVTARVVTITRRQLVSDVAWYRSPIYNEYHRLAGIDDELVSVCQVTDEGAISAVTLLRSPGEREFSPRELRLVKFFHDEVSRLIGHALVSATEPSPERLSPRLRQTLACLLQGDSEKQVAARLGLSHATTHQYVTGLYRYFRVTSRAQLLAHMLGRGDRDGWRQLRLSADKGPGQSSSAT
jgi:DNA-binding CsgD family transcriptional regulator